MFAPRVNITRTERQSQGSHKYNLSFRYRLKIPETSPEKPTEPVHFIPLTSPDRRYGPNQDPFLEVPGYTVKIPNQKMGETVICHDLSQEDPRDYTFAHEASREEGALIRPTTRILLPVLHLAHYWVFQVMDKEGTPKKTQDGHPVYSYWEVGEYRETAARKPDSVPPLQTAVGSRYGGLRYIDFSGSAWRLLAQIASDLSQKDSYSDRDIVAYALVHPEYKTHLYDPNVVLETALKDPEKYQKLLNTPVNFQNPTTGAIEQVQPMELLAYWDKISCTPSLPPQGTPISRQTAFDFGFTLSRNAGTPPTYNLAKKDRIDRLPAYKMDPQNPDRLIAANSPLAMFSMDQQTGQLRTTWNPLVNEILMDKDGKMPLLDLETAFPLIPEEFQQMVVNGLSIKEAVKHIREGTKPASSKASTAAFPGGFGGSGGGFGGTAGGFGGFGSGGVAYRP